MEATLAPPAAAATAAAVAVVAVDDTSAGAGQPLTWLRADGADCRDPELEPVSSDERSTAASQVSTVDTAHSSQLPALLDPHRSSQSSLATDDGAPDTTMDTDVPLHPQQLPAEAPVAPRPLPNGVADARSGQKRTASGHVKTASATTASSVGTATGAPRDGPVVSHKRNTSTNTQMNELSAQLRARLSYAMLKVQNGWEGRTLDEIETLAAQRSPRTMTSPWRATATAAPGGARSPGRPPSSTAATMQASDALNGSLQYYASAMHQTSSAANGSHPALAPPVDLARSHPRRSTAADRAPPPLSNGQPASTSNLSASSASSLTSTQHAGSFVPATPPLHDTPSSTLQTPSQRATASERDAIETLLFMSSPGNSQTFRHPAANGTPHAHALSHAVHPSPPRPAARTPLSPNGSTPRATKQVSFRPMNIASLAMVDAADRVPLSPRKRGLLEGANLETEAAIDRVLDQMPADGDGESSSDESLGSVAPRTERPERPVAV